MKILAIDSSGLVASVAIVDEESLVGEYTVNYKKTHSQTLMPMLDEVARMIELDLNDIDAIAISAGPGSFTGLRIGSATAKGLGLALRKPLISIPTLEALAYNFFDTQSFICPLMDARRGQVYTAVYEFVQQGVQEVIEPSAIQIEEIIDELNNLDKEIIFLGDGVPVYRDIIEANMKVDYKIAPAHLSRQRAGAVGALALEYYKKNKFETAGEHAPEYLRLSQAERELKEKMG